MRMRPPPSTARSSAGKARPAEGSDIGYRIFGIGGDGRGRLHADPGGCRAQACARAGSAMSASRMSMQPRPRSSGTAAPVYAADGHSRRRSLRDAGGSARRGVLRHARRDGRDEHGLRPNQTGHCHWNELSTSDPAGGARLLPPASAGKRATPCRWARWATTSSSTIKARRSAP